MTVLDQLPKAPGARRLAGLAITIIAVLGSACPSVGSSNTSSDPPADIDAQAPANDSDGSGSSAGMEHQGPRLTPEPGGAVGPSGGSMDDPRHREAGSPGALTAPEDDRSCTDDSPHTEQEWRDYLERGCDGDSASTPIAENAEYELVSWREARRWWPRPTLLTWTQSPTTLAPQIYAWGRAGGRAADPVSDVASVVAVFEHESGATSTHPEMGLLVGGSLILVAPSEAYSARYRTPGVPEPVIVRGTSGWLGRISEQPESSDGRTILVLRWTEGDQEFLLFGVDSRWPRDDLLALADQLRPAP